MEKLMKILHGEFLNLIKIIMKPKGLISNISLKKASGIFIMVKN